jgi:hypothetical protein
VSDRQSKLIERDGQPQRRRLLDRQFIVRSTDVLTWQRTASTMTSGGERKPAKAERALGAGRGRRVLMPAVWLLEGGHRERNSAASGHDRRSPPEQRSELAGDLDLADADGE